MNHKKKVLFVNGNLHVGGIERSLIDLLTHLDYSRYEVDLFLIEEKGELVGELPSNVHLICADLYKTYGSFISVIKNNLFNGELKLVITKIIIILSHLFGNKALRLLCLLYNVGKKYDCAIAYRVGFSLEVVSYGIHSKKKYCWWHNGLCNYNPEEINTIQRAWNDFDAIIAVSKGCRQMILSSFPKLLPKRVKVIPNMVDIDRINTLAGLESPYSNDDSTLTIITVSRLCWEKHIEDIPQIASELIKQGVRQLKWYIVGEGDMRERIEEEIRSYSVEDYVYLLGTQPNPYPYIKYADMMVHTSHVESQGLTILEAMALRTSCVAVASMGPREYLNDSNGILTGQSIDSLVEGVIDMIHKVSDEEMVENAYNSVVRNFSPIIIVSLFEKLLNVNIC